MRENEPVWCWEGLALAQCVFCLRGALTQLRQHLCSVFLCSGFGGFVLYQLTSLELTLVVLQRNIPGQAPQCFSTAV